MERNIVHDNGNTAEMASGIELFNGDNNGYGAHNIVRYNLVYNQKSGLNNGEGIDSDNYSAYNDIYYNIVYGNDGPGITVWKANHINIYNNTVYGNAVNSSGQLTTRAEIDITSDSADVNNIVVKNNIAYATRPNTYAIYIDSRTFDSSGLNVTNNNWYAATANWYYWNNRGGSSLVTWNALDGVGTDFNSDPLLVSTSDFRLRPTSPAIDAGTDVGLTVDHRGSRVPVGSAPDIGACEYEASSSLQKPTRLKIVTQ